MKATKENLSELHGRLASAMSEALTAETKRIEFTNQLLNVKVEDLDEETAKHVSNALSLAPTARVDNALLKTVASFLKENDITADDSTGDEIDATAERLNMLKNKRRVAETPLDSIN